MKTTKPISTVSYNSAQFLYGVLQRLVSNEIIQFFAFIEHTPEEDEKKSHFHVYLEPAKPVDTLWLRKQFIEPVKDRPNEPLASLPFQSSKWVDWYWYVLHDPAYLAAKNQSRKYTYIQDDIVTNDLDYLLEKVRVNPNPKAELVRVLDMLQAGYRPLQIAAQLNVPIRNLGYFMDSMQVLANNIRQITDRNGRVTHEGIYTLKKSEDNDDDE